MFVGMLKAVPLFLLFFSLSIARATEVSIQRVDVPPLAVEDVPYSYLQIAIGGELYRCTLLGDWGYLDNAYGYDFVATPPPGILGFVALRIEPFVDKDGKPLASFTKDLADAAIKRLCPEPYQYEGEIPVISDGTTAFEMDVLRKETDQSWKCHYLLEITEGTLRVFACEARPDHFAEVMSKFALFTGTFCLAPPPSLEPPPPARP